MERERRVRAARSLTVALALSCVAACDGGLFDYQDHELVDCWPDCPADAGALDGAGAGDALLPLEAVYTTTNSVTWSWSAESLTGEVVSYSLRSSPSAEVVAGGGGDLWSELDDGNLGYRESPHGPGVVRRTTITDLDAHTTYHARLYAHYDGGGSEAVAAGVAETLPEPASRLVFFSEELPLEAVLDGFLEPESADRAHEGTRALWFWSEGVAWQEAGLTGRGLEIEAITEARWQSAFLEYYIDLDFPADLTPIYYIETSLRGSTGARFDHLYTALPARAGWHRVQLPLRAFLDELDRPSTSAAVGAFLDAYVIGAAWPNDVAVFVDDIAVRY